MTGLSEHGSKARLLSTCSVSKVTRELMLLEAEKQCLQEELQKTRSELQLLQTQHLENLSTLESAVSREEHAALVSKLHRWVSLQPFGNHAYFTMHYTSETPTSIQIIHYIFAVQWKPYMFTF